MSYIEFLHYELHGMNAVHPCTNETHALTNSTHSPNPMSTFDSTTNINSRPIPPGVPELIKRRSKQKTISPQTGTIQQAGA